MSPHELDGGAPEPQHSMGRSTLLHLVPGVLITVFYLLAAPAVIAGGYPPMMALLLAILFVAIPIELGDLLRRGRLRHGRLTLSGVVSYRSPLPWWHYAAYTFGFLVLAALITGALGGVEAPLTRAMSRLFPPWFFLNQIDQYVGYDRGALTVTLVVNLGLNGLAAPVVEELYFRGYLLPRLAHLGVWAPVVNAGLFTLYHFWQPYSYVSIFVVMLPLVYLVWWKRNVYLGVAVHSALNVVGNLLLFAALLSRTS